MKRFCLLLIPAALLGLILLPGCNNDTKPAITRLTLTPLCGVVPLQVEGYVAVSGGNETGDATGSTNNLEITWNFGDGQTSTTSRAFNTYTQAGEYDVVVTAKDPDGNTTSTTLPVRALADSLLLNVSSNYPDGAVTTADTIRFSPRAESCDIDPDNPGDFAKMTFRWDMGTGYWDPGADVDDPADDVWVEYIFTEPEPEFRYAEAGDYDVSVVITYPLWAVVRRDTLHFTVTDAP